jgi:hypothetical protein
MKPPIIMCFISLLAANCHSAAANPPPPPAGYSVFYEPNFTTPGAIKDFVFSDAKAWRIAGEGDDRALELFGKSKYQPKDRSPFNIALVADKVFGDFVLDVEVQSTVKPYNHQDMCLFYGFEATNKYYYTHIAVKPDPNAHNIFVVNNAPRRSIAKDVSPGVTWGEKQWHKVRIERRLSEGTIKVFFDDFAQPIMQVQDKTCGKGFIGFGSFDDLGKFRNIKIHAPAVEQKKIEFFQRAVTY